MIDTYYLDGQEYNFSTQEELDKWLAANPSASKTNDKVDLKPELNIDVEPSVGPTVESANNFGISQQDFLELSEAGYGLFGKGREEVIVPKLRETYAKDINGNASNIKFEETGSGNSVKITLPGNNYGEVFDLPSADDVDGVQKAYVDITEYIESRKKLQISDKAKSKIENVFTSRDLKTKQTDKGVEYTQYDVADPVFRRDENIAKELNLILGNDGYDFEEQKMFTNAVKVTLPNKNSRVFNVNESNKEAYNQIINFIQTDNKGYKQTKKYEQGVEALDSRLNDLISKYVESDKDAMLLSDDGARSTLKRKITNEINSAGWQQLFFADREEFKDLSRDEKSELVDHRIQEVLNNATEGFTNKQTITRVKNKRSQGFTDNEIETEVETSTKNNFKGTNEVKRIKQTIFDLGLELENEDITEERKQEILGFADKPGLLAQANAIREDLEGIEYNYFIDPMSGERALTMQSESQIIDLTDKVQEKQQKLIDDKLTRKELRKEWLYTNLAHSQTVDDYKNKKRTFKIKGDVRNFMKTFSDIVVKDGMAVISDARATRIGGTLLDLGDNDQYNSRLNYLKEISTDKEVYNKMYALNEDLFSQKKSNFVESVGVGLRESVSTIFGGPSPADEMRQAYLGTMQDLGIETTAEEEEYANTTLPEMSGRAIGGLPKLIVDFYVANKVTTAMTAISGVTKIVQGLNAKKFVVGGKRLTQSGLVTHINKVNPRFLKGVPANQQGAKIAQWVTKNKIVVKPPSFQAKAMSTAIMANVEGVKMEIAMQDPFGLSGIEAPIGSSYATGVGFGVAGQIIPWAKMWTGLTGNRAGAWKGFYDYVVAAPINFEIGARAGELVNALADDMLGNETWSNFMEEHYGDFDKNLKHTISNLITGFAMKLGHFNKFDFASEGKLQAVNRAARIKLDKLRDNNKLYDKKGELTKEAEKANTLVSMSEFRLAQIRDTKDYLDPVLGPLKLFNDFLPTIEGAKVKGQTRFTYDYNMPKGKNMSFTEVKPGELLADGKGINKSKKSIYEFKFNPNKINPGLAPHELGHFGLSRIFTEDVMFKAEFINSLTGIMKKIKTTGKDRKTGESKEMTLFEAFENSGLWKRQDKFRQRQVKEEEMFAFLGEYLSKEGNLDIVRKSYGFDILAGFLENTLKDKLGQTTNLNTEKEVLQWFSTYIETIGKSKSIMPNIKALNKFVSRTKTDNQRKRRAEYESKNGTGETVEKRSEDLVKRIKVKENGLKNSPVFQQWKDKEISTEEYLEKTKQLRNDLVEMRKNLKNMPKEEVFSKETKEGKIINDFAKKDGRMMTNAEWRAKGKDRAMLELYKENGAFVGIITKGLDFSKGGIEGRSRETWIEDVSFGIEGKGKKDKETGEQIKTFVTKGIRGLLENFKPETDLQGNESLSGWVNRLYQLKRGDVYNHYEANPLGVPLGKKAGEGQTIGDRLMADKDYALEAFENIDLSKEFVRNKKGEFKEVVKVPGERKLENELPVDNKVFNEKGGWKQTIVSEIPGIKNKENASYKNIGDLAPNFTFDLVGAKLTPTQKKNPNDFNQVSLKNLQDFVGSKFKQPVMEESVNKNGEKIVRQKLNEKGEPVFRDINIGETSADLFRDATVKFDKGVSDKIQGTSNFKRLGVLGDLYHKASAKDYTAIEMKNMGYDVNPKPDASGAWRVASGPGGNIFIRGKSKGKDITAKDVMEFLGQKPDGTFKTLSEDRTLAGKSRRFIDEIGAAFSSQQVDIAVKANPNIVGEVNSARFLLNTSAGRSRKIYSEALENVGKGLKPKERLELKKEFFAGINSNEFSYLYSKYRSKTDKNPLGKALKDYFTSLGPESAFNVNNAKQTASEMLKIGKQLEAKLGLEGVTGKLKALKTRVAKILLMEQDLNAIERNLGLEATDATYLFDAGSKGGIKLAQSLDAMLMETFEKKNGKGWYEAIMLLGNTSGTGIGGKRRAIYRTANDARSLAGKVKTTKDYKDISRPDSNRQGNKKALMDYVEFTPNGAEINVKRVKEAYKHGEINKKNLKQLIKEIRRLYKARDKDGNRLIDHNHVRAFLEVAGGPMEGILKKSASLAIVPKGTGKELFKLFGSEWVLEHIIPAKFAKARIYEYILSGTKQSKQAMDLMLKDFHTTFIPKNLDTNVNKLYKSELPPEWLPGMDALEWRYYRNAYPADFNIALKNVITGKVYDTNPSFTHTQAQARARTIKAANAKLFGDIGLKQAVSKRLNSENLESAKKIDKALENARRLDKKSRGASIFDFDETVAFSENFVYAKKGKETKKISSSKWPEVGDKLLKEGWKMDFTDFNKVTKGKPGPLMQKLKNQIKKYGSENVFILTARAKESQKAIYDYLKSEGVNIPIKNITGLGNSTGEAKALWMLEKFAEGYNDMYFVDDAMSNVKAVKNVLDQLDIKSSVQQARTMYSENLDVDINSIMEHSLNIDSKKVFSKAEGKIRGKDIKRRRVFMRDSAADLELLIEPLYGKGKQGSENKKWFKENFVMPFERGTRDYNIARQSAKNDYMALRKQNKDVVKLISKEVEGTNFTNDMAMRVYLWNKAGYKIPDLAKTSETKLVEHVKNNPKLQAYAEQFGKITKQEKGLKEPSQNWWAETMAGEVTNIDRGVSRKQFLQQFIDVKNVVFSEKNLNKMESKLGTRWRENIEDMFDRMETGRTRSLKLDRGSSAMMNYLNGGIGTIMNFNTRSAALQTISTLNFLNMRENNPISAARAMANIPQFAKDFKFIMNSPMLKQRRDGLSINVTEAEIASAAASSPNMIQGIIAKILKVGYTPTKLADSFAISFGGATFYRNRIRMYEKQGVETKAAEKQAFLDFQVLAERTQQSSRADLLSKQQTSLVGRIVLPFANTPMQMNRAGMKDILDIAKGRTKGVRDVSEAMGRIAYYMGAQVTMFAGLQSALFAMLFNDEDVTDEKIASTKAYTLQSTMSSMLRGFGVQGALIDSFKNATMEFLKQNAKPGFKADYSEVAEDLLNISPPIGSKYGMLDSAGDDLKYSKKIPFKLELGNPKLEAGLKTIQAVTNAPVYSPYQNIDNLKHALSDKYETWQRVLMGAGWTPFNVGIEEKKKTKKKKKKSTKFNYYVE
jgi:hypothetical protein